MNQNTEHALNESQNQTKNRLSLLYISFILLAMFGFGFALVPIYEFICDKTGLNGRSENLVQATSSDVSSDILDIAVKSSAEHYIDTSREVTVVFEGVVGGALPWSFKPVKRKVVVHPGESVTALFLAENIGSSTIVGQAVPQVSPVRAAPYFEKTECFCFTEQELKAGEIREMPVLFVVDRNLPKFVDRIRLSYTFFVANDNLATKNKSANAASSIGAATIN